jgi:hypothetical protein
MIAAIAVILNFIIFFLAGFLISKSMDVFVKGAIEVSAALTLSKVLVGATLCSSGKEPARRVTRSNFNKFALLWYHLINLQKSASRTHLSPSSVSCTATVSAPELALLQYSALFFNSQGTVTLFVTVPPLFADRIDVHFPYGWVTA